MTPQPQSSKSGIVSHSQPPPSIILQQHCFGMLSCHAGDSQLQSFSPCWLWLVCLPRGGGEGTGGMGERGGGGILFFRNIALLLKNSSIQDYTRQRSRFDDGLCESDAYMRPNDTLMIFHVPGSTDPRPAEPKAPRTAGTWKAIQYFMYLALISYPTPRLPGFSDKSALKVLGCKACGFRMGFRGSLRAEDVK